MRIGFLVAMLLFLLGAAYVSHAPTNPLRVAIPYVEQLTLAQASPIESLIALQPREIDRNPLSGRTLYVEPNTPPAQQAQAWKSDRPTDAHYMELLAAQPRAVWFGTWNTNVAADVERIVEDSERTGSTSVLVAYDVPSFSCDAYEQNHEGVMQQYLSWMQQFAVGIGNRHAVVILEPDAVAGRECLNLPGSNNLIARAVSILKRNANTIVYIDAGNAMWNNVKTMATKLTRAGIAQADGFSLNVSNYITNEDTISYGAKLSEAVGGKHFVIDTSRNGNGPTANYEWCNPSGRAIGTLPSVQTGNPLVDAYLWIKQPGESDGTCNGGPAAGTWWPDYALGLVRNRTTR